MIEKELVFGVVRIISTNNGKNILESVIVPFGVSIVDNDLSKDKMDFIIFTHFLLL